MIISKEVDDKIMRYGWADIEQILPIDKAIFRNILTNNEFILLTIKMNKCDSLKYQHWFDLN
jgi:hypothetical protein